MLSLWIIVIFLSLVLVLSISEAHFKAARIFKNQKNLELEVLKILLSSSIQEIEVVFFRDIVEIRSLNGVRHLPILSALGCSIFPSLVEVTGQKWEEFKAILVEASLQEKEIWKLMSVLAKRRYEYFSDYEEVKVFFKNQQVNVQIEHRVNRSYRRF